MMTLKELRELRGKSLETLAGDMGVTVGTIKNWESGRITLSHASFEKVIRLTAVLQITLQELQPLLTKL